VFSHGIVPSQRLICRIGFIRGGRQAWAEPPEGYQIGDIVGASVVGSTPHFPQKSKSTIINVHADLQVSRVGVALLQNTRKRFQTLSGRFPRERSASRMSLRPESRKLMLTPTELTQFSH